MILFFSNSENKYFFDRKKNQENFRVEKKMLMEIFEILIFLVQHFLFSIFFRPKFFRSTFLCFYFFRLKKYFFSELEKKWSITSMQNFVCSRLMRFSERFRHSLMRFGAIQLMGSSEGSFFKYSKIFGLRPNLNPGFSKNFKTQCFFSLLST